VVSHSGARAGAAAERVTDVTAFATLLTPAARHDGAQPLDFP